MTSSDSDQSVSFLQIIRNYEVPTPMRDGVVLRSNIFTPAKPGRYPAILWRTPYNKNGTRADDLVRAGYVVVVQDMRGRYASDGVFQSFLVPTEQHAEDGYDMVEWLATQPWCDGNVGTMGTSYPGWTQWMLAKLRPPHLKCICAFAIPTEVTSLDYPGAFRLGRRLHWLLNTLGPDLRKRAGMSEPHTTKQSAELWKTTGEDWLKMMPVSKLAEHLPPPLCDEVAAWMKNPGERVWRFDEAWQHIEVPNLEVTGWYDHCHGIRHLAGMQQHGRTASARENTRLIIGPWNHITHGKSQTGPINYGPAANVNLMQLQLQWFDRWLKPDSISKQTRFAPSTPEPAVNYFVLGDDNDTAWRGATTWPPTGTQQTAWYLRENMALCETPSVEHSGSSACDEYTYDPADPVPTQWGASLMTEPCDRSVLSHRKDILRYRTAPLENDMIIAGDPVVILHASSSAVDTDFFARLIDEDGQGRCFDLCLGMVRTRHRNGLCTEEMMSPGEVYELNIQLGPIACLFKKGHRIQIEITSSDFPNYDRNHNTDKPNLHDATLLIARQSIHRDKLHPSRLILPVLEQK